MKRCFFISPIGEDESETRKWSDQVLKHVIKPVISRLDFSEPLRSDIIGKAGSITNEIVTRLIEDDLVVADLTDHNPNVFYELAIRHITGKPVIHMKKKGDKTSLPFDVADIRTIFVNLSDPDDLEKARNGLEEQINSFDANPVITPVSKFKALKGLLETGYPEQEALAKIVNEITGIKSQIRETISQSVVGEISGFRFEIEQMMNQITRLENVILNLEVDNAKNLPPSTFVERRLGQLELKQAKGLYPKEGEKKQIKKSSRLTKQKPTKK